MATGDAPGRGGDAVRAPVELESPVTCPACEARRWVTAPYFSCFLTATCPSYGAASRPAAGDCGIFRTCGSVPRPAIQVRQRAEARR